MQRSSIEIPIKYVDGYVPRLKITDVGDWIDVYAWPEKDEIEIKKGEIVDIPLGFAMELPDEYEAYLAPRSSTPTKFHIMSANSFGIIDNSYAGDNDIWCFRAIAIEDTVIKKSDRIAQFRIQKRQPVIEFHEVDHLKKADRGGLGSTGNGVL